MGKIKQTDAHNRMLNLWTAPQVLIASLNTPGIVHAQESPQQPGETVFSQEQVQHIIPGKTGKEEVRRLVGEPDYSERKGIESHWTYYSSQKFRQLAKTVFIDYAGDTVSKVKIQRDGIKERKGFVLGVGYGLGTAKGAGNENYSDSNLGITFDIGYAPTERLAVIYSMDSVLSEGKQIFNSVQYTYLRDSFVSGVSLRLFPLAFWYIQAGYGFLVNETVFSNGKTYEVDGKGYSIHTGYEFALGRNWAMAPDFFYGKLHATTLTSETVSFPVNQKTTIKGMVLKFVWYP